MTLDRTKAGIEGEDGGKSGKKRKEEGDESQEGIKTTQHCFQE